MKKRTMAMALALCILLSGAALAAGGTQSDPLISLSYLNGSYWTALKSRVSGAVDEATRPIYDAAVSKAQQQTAADGSGWSVSGGFLSQSGTFSGTVTLSVGTGLIWTDGSGTVRSGVLVDATTGREAAVGASLTAGHRYLAAEEAMIAVESQAAGWMVEGRWKTAAGTGLPFTDVAVNSWYCDNVRYVVEKGLFNGVTGTSFKPAGTMTRGMAATVLYRVAGKPAVSYAPLFTDVPKALWYTDGAVWVGQNQIDTGSGGVFRPNEAVTRQELAVMLYNYTRYAGLDITGTADLSSFSDAGSVESWAKDAMTWAVSKGIMQGSGGRLKPGDSATRAEVAAMFQRFQLWLEA